MVITKVIVIGILNDNHQNQREFAFFLLIVLNKSNAILKL